MLRLLTRQHLSLHSNLSRQLLPRLPSSLALTQGLPFLIQQLRQYNPHLVLNNHLLNQPSLHFQVKLRHSASRSRLLGSTLVQVILQRQRRQRINIQSRLSLALSSLCWQVVQATTPSLAEATTSQRQRRRVIRSRRRRGQREVPSPGRVAEATAKFWGHWSK